MVTLKNPTLRFWQWMPPVLGELGTIRTEPENYYVASVYEDRITFKGIEAMTRNIDQDYVAKWARINIFKQ
mgnify:CR=1 FL=1